MKELKENMKHRPIKNKSGKMEIYEVCPDFTSIKIVFNGRYPREHEVFKDKSGDLYIMFEGEKVYL